MENPEQALKLYEKYLKGTISDQERDVLFHFFKTTKKEALYELADHYISRDAGLIDLDTYEEHTKAIFERIKAKIQPTVKVIKPNRAIQFIRIAAAVAAILLITFFIYQYNDSNLIKDIQIQQTAIGENINPGGNKATLQLADGRNISLDDVAVGELAKQNGVNITKTEDGQVVYEVLNSKEGESDFNMIATPKAGQFSVILPDGSKVYLNAVSSLRYPTRFAGAQRRVELTGEAYFEVAKNVAKPFIVSTNGQQIEVLGTHFNVNNYKDNNRTITTLAEGRVRVVSNNNTAVLSPGQQAVSDTDELHVAQADLETALAWKQGRMEYRGADLRTIMHDVERWYDIDVVFEGEIPDRKFVASVPRSSNLSTLLKILQLSNIKFRMEGNKLIVNNK